MEILLSEDKSVNISPWKSKTRKQFIKLFKEKKTDVLEDDIVDILVMPYIEPNNIFLSSDEIQYLLIKIREISLDNKISFIMECENCKEDFDVDIELNKLVNYSPGNFSKASICEWTDELNKDTFKKSLEKYPDEVPKDLEMLIHIKSCNDKDYTLDLDKLIDDFDDFKLSEILNIKNEYSEVKSKLEISSTIKCTKCGFSKKYQFDVIPSFFDPLMPK